MEVQQNINFGIWKNNAIQYEEIEIMLKNLSITISKEGERNKMNGKIKVCKNSKKTGPSRPDRRPKGHT